MLALLERDKLVKNGEPQAELGASHFEMRLAANRDEIEEAQRLRYQAGRAGGQSARGGRKCPRGTRKGKRRVVAAPGVSLFPPPCLPLEGPGFARSADTSADQGLYAPRRLDRRRSGLGP